MKSTSDLLKILEVATKSKNFWGSSRPTFSKIQRSWETYYVQNQNRFALNL